MDRWRAATLTLALVVGAAAGGCVDSGGPGGGGGAPAPTTMADHVTGLLAQLASPTARERRDAIEELAGLDDLRIRSALEDALGDGDLSVRSAAATALGERGDGASAAAIADALRREMRFDAEAAFYAAAAEALGTLGGPDGVPALIELLGAGDSAGRSAAIRAIAAIGADALPALRAALASREIAARLAAVDGLGALGDLGLKPLIVALGDAQAKVRSAAANRLGRLGDRSAEEPLVALLENPEWKTVSIALARLFRDEPGLLLKYLRSKATLNVYYGLLLLGADETVDALAAALVKLGDKAMAEDYLNCGNEDLEQAARDWAADHGYRVTTVPGSGGGAWGSGLPE